MSGWVGL
jgi:SAM-dependent methyltransferase